MSNCSIEYEDINQNLKIEAGSLKQEFEENGNQVGDLHLMWKDSKMLFSVDNHKAMLEEVIRGEKSVLNHPFFRCFSLDLQSIQ